MTGHLRRHHSASFSGGDAVVAPLPLPPPPRAAEGAACVATCRICLEDIPGADLINGVAHHLGCQCKAGLDTVHRACAERWFRIRCATVCEVCLREAEGLPEEVRHSVAARVASLSEPGQLLDPGLLGAIAPPLVAHGWADGWQVLLYVPAHAHAFLVSYALFCLAPTCLMAAALVLFLAGVLGVGATTTVVLSIVISSSCMVHWLLAPPSCARNVAHLALVALVAVGAMGAPSLLFAHGARTGLPPDLLAAGGAIGGALAGGALHTLAARALATALRALCRGRTHSLLHRQQRRQQARQDGDAAGSAGGGAGARELLPLWSGGRSA